MISILLYIKHNIHFIWRFIEWVNGVLFSLLHRPKFNKVLPAVISEFNYPLMETRLLRESDLSALSSFVATQNPIRIAYFKPHAFDNLALKSVHNNPAFIMMGVFDGPLMVGYFFLRCFWNRKCFVGRLVHENYIGKGIGKHMNDIMYNIAWRTGFRCLSTISKNNHSVMNAHAHNKTMVVLKELDNNYLFVEFLKP